MDETIELADRETLVKDDPELWDDFEEHIKMVDTAEELQAMADRLGIAYDSEWEWRDYAEAFSGETWRDVLEAYKHCTANNY